jgi:hypothetical protein
MNRQGEDYVVRHLDRFTRAKEALLKDDANYANHEEKRKQLLNYYQEKINSYEHQLRKIDTQRANGITVNGAECL